MDIDDDLENVPGAYLIIDPNNTKAYVGSTTELRRRALRHKRELKAGEHYNKELQAHYDKHNGNLVFVGTPLEDKETAIEFEQSIIDDFYGTDVLCNIASDARDAGKGFQLTEEHKAKLVQANTGRPKSEAHRQAISRTLTGRKLDSEHAEKARTARLGQTNSEGHNRRISESNKGRTYSEETRQKMSESGKQKVFTEEHRANMAKAQRGKTMSESNRAILDQMRKKPVQVNDVSYPSILDAAQALDMTSKMITTRLDSPKYPNFKRLPKT